MRKVVALAFVLLLALAQAQSQSPTRVLVLPFDAGQSLQPYGLGLAAGVQRALNSVDGFFAPPVGDGGLFVSRAFEAGLPAVATAVEAFDAGVVVTGAVTGSGENIAVTLVVSGTAVAEAQQLELQLPADPAAAVQGLLEAIAPLLGIEDEQSRLAGLAAESPALAHLTPVSRATARLAANAGELAQAATDHAESSWVLAEYARALALAGRIDEAVQVARRAVLANDDDAEAHVVEGIVARAAGNAEVARAAFEAALRINSSHALALAGLAGLAQEPAEAIDLYTRALAASPRLEDAVLGLAGLQPNHQQALQLLRRASSNLPESVELHRAFLLRAIEAGDAPGALAYLRQTVRQPLAASPALFGQAVILPDSLVEEALAVVQEGRALFPESSGLQLNEAELLRRAGRLDEALALLEDLYADYPESAEVANSLAVLLAQMGQMERAQEVFAAAAEENSTAQVNLARLLLQSGQARSALSLIEPLLESNPGDSELHTLHGVALGRLGRLPEARAALDRALELEPGNEEAGRARALIEQQQGVVGENAVAFEGEAAVEFEAGLHALETGDPAAAADSFRRAFELSGEGLAAFYQGYSLHLAGNVRSAIAPYREALAVYPESDVVLNNLGYAQLQVGRFDLALESLRRAEAANPENASVFVNLGLTYFGLGRYGDALEQWQHAMELDPGLQDDLAQIMETARQQLGE